MDSIDVKILQSDWKMQNSKCLDEFTKLEYMRNNQNFKVFSHERVFQQMLFNSPNLHLKVTPSWNFISHRN